jgi:carboxyl-terminal processing protease
MAGSFEGIGVQFEILEDTIMVVSPISGGPSDKLGIMAGDRIIKIEDDDVAGTGVTNQMVIDRLRGPKGTVVSVTILRPGNRKPLVFKIERDKIPLNSVDYSYMVDATTGYIKVNRFAETTMQEFDEHLGKLKQNGLKNLILDLRNNPGGYLQMSKLMAERFLEKGQLIVYTEGRVPQSNQRYVAASGPKYLGKDGGLIVLINQGSASASEIVSGAVQDHDRGLILGTRSFGKGLVQQQYELNDGSAIRVVVSRYYTPSGRCIQKDFKKSTKEYNEEVYERYETGEFFDPSKITFPDSLKFTTSRGRTVYGGGGIMPDVYEAPDTTGASDYLSDLISGNIFRQFAHRYTESHPDLIKEYPTGLDFAKRFKVTPTLHKEFQKFATEKGVEYDEKDYQTSKARIEFNIKALLARKVYNDDGFYPSVNEMDPLFHKALKLMPQAIEMAKTGKFEYKP